MNGSRVVTEMFYAAFGTHHPYSKIISYQMLPNTYIRFHLVSSPSSTTLGTKLCFQILHPNSSHTKRGASLAPLNFCVNAYVSNSILLVLVSHLLTGLQVPVPSCLVSDISSTHLWIYHNTGTADVFPL